MRNLYSDLAKIAQACPARPGRRWLVISLSLLTLIILSTSGCQVIALEPTGIAASGEDSTPGPALPLAQAQPDRLYILSHRLRSDGTDGAVGGRITILDPATGQASYVLETGVAVDVALSPDSSRLYVAGVVPPPDEAPGPGDDQLFALDLNTRAELWRVSLKSRIKYKGGDLATIAVSADGRWLYLYSFPAGNLDQYPTASQVPYWLEIMAAETGERLPETIPLPHCGSATLVMDPAEAMLYVACYLSNEVLFVNLATRQVERALKIPGAPFTGDDYIRIGGRPSSLVAMVMSPDGSSLYVVTDDLRIGLIEVAGRTLSQWIDHRQLDRVAVFNDSVALSADGTRLVVGERIDDEARGTTVGARLHVFDTATWGEVRQLQLDRPLHTLAIDRTGRTIYGVTTSFNGRPLPDADTLLPIRLDEPGDAAVGAPLKREGEAISRLFVGP